MLSVLTVSYGLCVQLAVMRSETRCVFGVPMIGSKFGRAVHRGLAGAWDLVVAHDLLLGEARLRKASSKVGFAETHHCHCHSHTCPAHKKDSLDSSAHGFPGSIYTLLPCCVSDNKQASAVSYRTVPAHVAHKFKLMHLIMSIRRLTTPCCLVFS